MLKARSQYLHLGFLKVVVTAIFEEIMVYRLRNGKSSKRSPTRSVTMERNFKLRREALHDDAILILLIAFHLLALLVFLSLLVTVQIISYLVVNRF